MLRYAPRDVPLDYSLCRQTVTIYRAEFAPEFNCKRQVINRAFFDFKRTENVDKIGSKGTSSFLLVVPGEADIKSKDKVLLGVGEEIDTREEWNDLIPAKRQGLAVIEYVEPKYWNGKICHMEAGG